jgi:hypothetical protein
MICDAIDEQQWLPGDADNLFELRRGEKGITPAAQQTDHRRAGARLLDFVALASGHPDIHMCRLTTDLRQHRGFSDSGVTGNQYHATGTMNARAAHDTERRRQRLVAAAQRPVGLGHGTFRRRLLRKIRRRRRDWRIIADHRAA